VYFLARAKRLPRKMEEKGGWIVTKTEGGGETGVCRFTRPVEPQFIATALALTGIKEMLGDRLEKFTCPEYGKWEGATGVGDRRVVMGRLCAWLVQSALRGFAAARPAHSALHGQAERFTVAEIDAAMDYGAGMIAAHFHNFTGAVHHCDPLVELWLTESKFRRAWELSLAPVRDIKAACARLGHDPALLEASMCN